MNTSNKVRHPCQKCGQICYGKQCKDCHLKMIEIRDGVCCDCKNTFIAIRKDGTKRIRCYDCQEIYDATFISKCACGAEYHKTNKKTGAKFKECLTCYKKRFIKCSNCDNTTVIDRPLCIECYTSKNETKKIEDEYIPPPQSLRNPNKIYELRKCFAKDCNSMTTYKYCVKCNKKNITIAEQYMISTCEKCGIREKGYFTICNYCK